MTEAGMRVERGIYKRGGQYWIRYGAHDRREPAGDKLEQARLLLAKRRVELGEGRTLVEDPRRLSLGACFDALLAHLEATGAKATSQATIRSTVNVLRASWGPETRALSVRPAAVAEYVQQRLEAGRARDSVHREVAVLRMALKLAEAQEHLPRGMAPALPGVGGLRVRQGFVEPVQFLGLLKGLSPAHADLAEYLYVTGRRYTEGVTLTWAQVGEEEIRWAPLKNGHGLTMPLHRLYGEILERRRRQRVVRDRLVPLVFHDRGRSLRHSMRTEFKVAARVAGLDGLVPHDLRRSATRNLLRAGVPEGIAMRITGHRSRSTFDRYNIVSTADQTAALDQLAVYLDDKLGRVVPFTAQRAAQAPSESRG